jgi:hypothetical protein
MVYQSRVPPGVLAVKSVKSGNENQLGIEGQPPHEIPERRAEQYRQRRARAGEDGVPGRPPQRVIDVDSRRAGLAGPSTSVRSRNTRSSPLLVSVASPVAERLFGEGDAAAIALPAHPVALAAS